MTCVYPPERKAQVFTSAGLQPPSTLASCLLLNNTPYTLRWQLDHIQAPLSTGVISGSPEITPVTAQLYVWTKLFTQDPAAVLPSRDSFVSIKARGVRVFLSSHQGPEVRQVDVAVFVHLHHLHLHAGHLSARWVGAVRRLGDQTHLE